jgi:hypothetical protein
MATKTAPNDARRKCLFAIELTSLLNHNLTTIRHFFRSPGLSSFMIGWQHVACNDDKGTRDATAPRAFGTFFFLLLIYYTTFYITFF